MRITFIDQMPWDYVVETPRVKPLGGSQSALCYLAEELVRLGHEVTLLNGTTTPGVCRGVKCLRLDQVPIVNYAGDDFVIVLNVAISGVAQQIRSAGARTGVLVLWSQHNHDQPAVKDLAERSNHDSWDEYVLVSEWQARGYTEAFGLDPRRIKILGNAIAPAFENLFPETGSVAAEKRWPPVLCYTSTPFRGLDVLLEAFPRIRAAIPGTRLRVFSSMSVYGFPPEKDKYAALYDRCRATDGVEYVGSVSQTELARELRQATCLAYPNTFAEGFCISVLEAMAAGCLVISSDLGALRDTTAGFGHLLVPHPDKETHARQYADFAVRVLNHFRSSEREQRRLAEQVAAVNRTGTWSARAREWEAWLASRLAPRAQGSSLSAQAARSQ
jgi:glycosyltransferase involved in cell wall biosynthesis